MKTIQELEKNYREDTQYFKDDTNPYKQNDLDSLLDSSAGNSIEKAINHYYNDENDFYNEAALDNEKDLNNNDPYPDDDVNETDEEDLDEEDLDEEDEIEDLDAEDDLDDEDDFQEDDLEDADNEIDATNPRNPSQF
jgi:hypothetical protein